MPDPNIIDVQNDLTNPETPDDATPKEGPETVSPPIDRLNLPNVPTQDEVDPPEAIAETGSIEAPYGLNKDGSPAKKRGRKAKGEEGQSPQFDRLDSVSQARPLTRAKSTAKPTEPYAPLASTIATDYQAMGETAANVWFNVGVMALGEDWAPNPDEPKAIASAFRDYFKAKEIKAIDPGIVLLIALGGYTVARVNKPTVQSRFSKVAQWVRTKIRR
jgi:hypothetical protein